MSTSPTECAYCNTDHASHEPCPELDRRDCGHFGSEDCMICTICGECSESLDDDDMCADCAGEVPGE